MLRWNSVTDVLLVLLALLCAVAASGRCEAGSEGRKEVVEEGAMEGGVCVYVRTPSDRSKRERKKVRVCGVYF